MPGSDGRYVSIKEFNRDNYGFFGAGGRIVGGIFKKTASTIGKGAWWLGKTMAKGYVHAAMLPFQVPYYAVKGIAKVGGWAANSIGINPFRDIYVVGEDEPILTWRKQASKEGVYFAGTKTRPKSSKEIIEKGLPIVDHEGQYLITKEDIKKGLWAKDSSVVKGIGAVAGGIIKAPFSVASAYIKMETEVIKGMFGIGKTIAKGIFGSGAPEKYVDVYRKGEFKKPILTRRKQKEGVYLKDKDGNLSRLERSSDIHEPVYEIINGEPQEVVSEEDIEHGLCDVNGKPLGSGQYRGGLLGAAIGLGAGLGKLGLKVLGGGAGMFFSFWKNTFGLLGKAGGAVVSGVRHLGARLFGLDSKNGHGAIAFRGVTDRLDTIIELMRSGTPLGGVVADATPTGKPKRRKAVKGAPSEDTTTEAPSGKPSEKKTVHASGPASSKVGRSEGSKSKSVKDKISWGFNKDDADDDDDGDSSWTDWLLGGGSVGAGGLLWKKGRQKVKDILTGANRPRTIVKHPDGKFRTLDGKLVSAEEVKAAKGRIWEKGKDGVMRDHTGKPVKDTTIAKRKASDKGKSSPVEKTPAKGGKKGAPEKGKPSGKSPKGKPGEGKFRGKGKRVAGWIGGLLGAKMLWDAFTDDSKGETLSEKIENTELNEVAPSAALASTIPEYLLANKAPGLSKVFGRFGSWFMPILAATETANAVDNSEAIASALTGKDAADLTQTEKDVAKAEAMGTAVKDYNPISFGADMVNMGWQLFGGDELWSGNAYDATVRNLTGAKDDAEVFRRQTEYAEFLKKNGMTDPNEMSRMNSSQFNLGWDSNSSFAGNVFGNAYNLLGAGVTHWNDQGYSWYNPLEWGRVAHNAATDTATYTAKTFATLLQLPWAWEKAKNEAAGIEHKARWQTERQMRKLIKVTQLVTKIFENEGVKLPPECYHTSTVTTTEGLPGEKILHSKGDVNLESEAFQQLWQDFSKEKNTNGKSFFSRTGEDVTKEFAKWLVKKGYVDEHAVRNSEEGYYKNVRTLRWMKHDNTPYYTYNISGELAKNIQEDKLVEKLGKDEWPKYGSPGGNVGVCMASYLCAFKDVRLFYLVYQHDKLRGNRFKKALDDPNKNLFEKFNALELSVFNRWFDKWIDFMSTDIYGAGGGVIRAEDPGVKGWWNRNFANSSIPIVRWLSPTLEIDRRPDKEEQDALKESVHQLLDRLYWRIHQSLMNIQAKEKLESTRVQQDLGDGIYPVGEKIAPIDDKFATDMAYKVIEEMEGDGSIESGVTGDDVLKRLNNDIVIKRKYERLTPEHKKAFDAIIRKNLRKVLKDTHPELATFTGDEADVANKTANGSNSDIQRRVDNFANTVVATLRNPSNRKKIFDKYNVAYNPDDPDYTTLANAISREVPKKYMGLTDATDIENAQGLLRDAIIDKVINDRLQSAGWKVKYLETKGVDRSLIAKPTPSKETVTPEQVEAARVEATTAQHAAAATAISKAVGPTIEAARQLDNSRAITDGFNSMTNLQNKSFSLLGSIIGPNGLKVEGIPELTAVTAAKPSGGNVTNITNVMPVRTQDEGLDVRASQK